MSDYNLTRKAIVAIKSHSVKGTPADSGLLDAIYVTSCDFPSNERNRIDNGDEYGVEYRDDSTLLDYTSGNATIVYKLSVEGIKAMQLLNDVFGATLGNGYTFTADTPAVGLNTHKTVFQGAITSPKWNTLLKDMLDDVEVCESALVQSYKIEVTGGYFQVTVTFIVDKASRQAGFTNTATYGTQKPKYTFFPTTNYYRINDSDGAALSSSNNQNIKGLSIEVTRGFETCEPVGGGGGVIANAYEATPPDIMVTFIYCKKDTENAAYFDAYENETDKKIEIYLQGPAFDTVVNYKSMLFQFPKMRLLQAPTFGSASPYEATAVFSLMNTNGVAPANMATVTAPTVTVVNEQLTLI